MNMLRHDYVPQQFGSGPLSKRLLMIQKDVSGFFLV